MKIALINMPFGYLRLPSIALTQLKSIIDDRYPDQIKSDILYFNLEFGNFLGSSLYDFIAESPAAMHCNIGEWFFRQVAFPGVQDNTEEYLSHFELRLQTHDVSMQSTDLNLLRFYTAILLSKRDQLDAFLDQLISTYHLTEYDVIGLTSMFSQNLPVFALARKLKEKNDKIILVMGGANCESPMGEAILKNIPSLDYVFSGPALISFPLFIERILYQNYPGCAHIDGVFCRQNVDRLEQAGILKRGKELSIDQSPRLYYDDFVQLITNRWKGLNIVPVLLFETSRGCWWGAKSHCTFCGLNTNSMAYRSLHPDLAIKMIQDLMDRYHEDVKHYSSVDNIMPKEYLTQVFPFIKVPQDASMFYEVKSDLSKQELEVLAKARILTLQPGIESLNTTTLKLMKKGETAVGNIAFLKNAAGFNIDIAWNILLGFPGEEDTANEVYNRDFTFLFHLQSPKSVYAVRFDRYSPYHSNSKDYGLQLVPADFYFLLYPDWMSNELSQIAYYFENADQQAPHKEVINVWMPKLTKISKQWSDRYYMEDELLKPQLYYDYEYQRIYDSRDGQQKKDLIDALSCKILEASDQPIKLISLFQQLNIYSQEAILESLDQLISKGYIYHENHKKYLSLVHMSNAKSEARDIILSDSTRLKPA